MKLKIKGELRAQPDPYIFEDNGLFYLYVTGKKAVEMYRTEDIFGEWKYMGAVCHIENGENYWAPCVIKIGEKYFMYFSYSCPEECMCVAVSDSAEGPFVFKRKMLNEFSIDAHVVENETGLYMFYAKDNLEDSRMGTRIYVDKMLDPYTLKGEPVEVIRPTLDEEIFMKNKYGDGRNWHTIEGPFYFREGAYHYLMYSGACYQNDSYHIGYAYAKSEENDLTKLNFIKRTDEIGFSPLLFKNEFEEGTGHNSLINYNNNYYILYHGRDIGCAGDPENNRTARICKLKVENNFLTAERM